MQPTFRTVLAAALTAALLPAAEARTPRAPATPAACVDFDAHANAEWRRSNLLPAGVASVSRLGQLDAATVERRRALLQEVVRAPRDERERLLATFWAAGTDAVGLDARSSAAVGAALAPVAGLKRARDLPKVSAAFHAIGLSPLVEFVRLDGNPGPLAAAPAPLGLGDPAFYVRQEPEIQRLIGQYRAYLDTLFRAAGLDPAQASAASEAVLQIESRLAQALDAEADDARAEGRLREQDRRYAKVGLAETLDRLGADPRDLVVLNPGYFAALAQVAGSESPERLRALLKARVLMALAPALGTPFRTAHGQFEGQVLRGLASPPDLEAVTADLARHALPGLIDAVANSRWAEGPRRERAEVVVRAVQAAAAGRDPRFSDVTIDLAGSATPPPDVSDLRFEAGDHVGNLLRLWRWQEQRTLAGRPQAISPFPALRPAVQFDAAARRLSISAAALAPPLLGDAAGPADFGAFGALVGHEMAKAVDAGDRGRGLVALYNGFEATPGVRVNGTRTFAMNRADLAGLEFAWAAFAASSPAADVGARRAFFAGWAGVWAQQASVDALRSEAATSDAAPSRWRVNGPLSQLPAFADAFSCRAGQPMRAAAPIGVWR
ncbi:MAG: hypothetical protein O9303_03000 [Silanimonas sp.]|jgi:putative endopeptidase|nr:hypothetical protein [Silanimonas sp.]